MTVGGADLAGQALTAGLVDELQLFPMPAIVGGGKPALPAVRSCLDRRYRAGRLLPRARRTASPSAGLGCSGLMQHLASPSTPGVRDALAVGQLAAIISPGAMKASSPYDRDRTVALTG
jgi:hypothetical protein